MLQKSEDLNQFKANYSVFMRSSRDVSRQCLFFLSILRKTNQEKIDAILTDFSEYALIKVKALTNGVKVPNKDDTNASGRIKKNLYYWQKKIREKLDNVKTLSLEDVPDLKERFVTFLKITREDDIKQCLQYHIIPLVMRFAIKNIYLILGVILVGIVLFFVDVVSNLLFNEGWYLLLPMLGLFAGLAASTAVIIRHPIWIIGWGDFFNPWVVPPGRGIRRWPEKKFETQNLISKRILLTALMTAGFLMVIGLVLWIIEIFAPAFLGKTSLTIYIMLGLAFLFLLLCHLVDMWDFYDPRHIRLAALGLGLFFLAATLTTAHARLATLAVLLSLTFFASVSIKRHPRDALRWILALLFLGSTILTVRGHFTVKEAIWSHYKSDDRPITDIRIEVDEWPYKILEKDNYPIVVMAASGGGSRAALYTALTLKNLNMDFAHIASKLHAISSVSGGSLATAVYISELYNAYKQGQEPDLTNLDQRVNQDYLRPTLVGALWPGTSRGDRIEDSWRKNPVGLGNITIANLSEAWRKAKNDALEFPPFPLALFNSCSLDGHDVVISPLPQETYLWGALYDQGLPRSKWHNEGKLTWVFSRNAIYGFEKLLDRFNPRLYEAVRASTNFPFGFPLVEIETDASLMFNPKCGGKKKANASKKSGGLFSKQKPRESFIFPAVFALRLAEPINRRDRR